MEGGREAGLGVRDGRTRAGALCESKAKFHCKSFHFLSYLLLR
jgi:hypothetical protein